MIKTCLVLYKAATDHMIVTRKQEKLWRSTLCFVLFDVSFHNKICYKMPKWDLIKATDYWRLRPMQQLYKLLLYAFFLFFQKVEDKCEKVMNLATSIVFCHLQISSLSFLVLSPYQECAMASMLLDCLIPNAKCLILVSLCWHLRTRHSYRRENYGEPSMVRKGVVFWPSTFLHLRREQYCIFYTETNGLLPFDIGNILVLFIPVFVSLIWLWLPQLLLQSRFQIKN